MKPIKCHYFKPGAVYIHLPFCTNICSYCDFTKILYQEKYIADYIDALSKEISHNYKGELIKTIYIGGGTPSCLSIKHLQKLFMVIKMFNCAKEVELTMELNPNDLSEQLLLFLYKNKVNRLSIGVQTFNLKHLKVLNRTCDLEQLKKQIKIARKIGFNNISVDLIYALVGQTHQELKEDLEEILKLDIEHISTYSLMIEPRTMLYIKGFQPLDEDLDYEMYQMINDVLTKNGYLHYEISNYCQPNYESKHNLVYWNNLPYYGFGMGASGYIDNIRYTNTSNINKYINFQSREEEVVSLEEKLQNEFMLGFRKIKGINKQVFYEKYGFNLEEMLKIKQLIKEGKLISSCEYIYVNSQYIYILNSILVDLMV